MQPYGQGGSAVPFRLRVAGAVLLVAYLVFVGWLTLRPVSVPWVPPSNLRPFATIRENFSSGAGTGLRGVSGEVLLLAPLGVLFPVATGQLLKPALGTAVRTVLTGTFVSVLLLVLRSFLLGRMVDVDSMLLNTAGVGLAHALLCPPLRYWHRRAVAQRRGAVRERRVETPSDRPRPRAWRVPRKRRGVRDGERHTGASGSSPSDPARGSTPRAPRVEVTP